MNAAISNLPEVYTLTLFPSRNQSQIRSNLDISALSRYEGSSLEDAAPENATTDQRPTRRYQIMLLLSGFFMTFHVIGINLVYGIFQVSCTTICP